MARPAHVRRRRLLLHAPFAAFGSALLAAAFGSDLMYCETSLMQWADFSAWLINGGLFLGFLSAVLLLVDLLLRQAGPVDRFTLILLAIAAVLSIFNALIHSRDAWTSVVPQGITLSAIVAMLLLVISVRGWGIITAEGSVRGEAQ
jgi:uncharacterized membrane protein